MKNGSVSEAEAAKWVAQNLAKAGFAGFKAGRIDRVAKTIPKPQKQGHARAILQGASARAGTIHTLAPNSF
jgi:hypothetical protein